MIAGVVDESGCPYIMLEVRGRFWKAVIDTGFNGDFELPEAMAEGVNARYYGAAKSLLAGNQVIEEDFYIVEVPFDGRTVRGLATFVPGDGMLLGTNVLREYRQLVDFPNRQVQITSVS